MTILHSKQNVFLVVSLWIALAVSLLLTGCGNKEEQAYSGMSYPPTQRIATAFQYTQVPEPCTVFAHVLAEFPSSSNGRDIQQALIEEAAVRGSDIILLGQSRERGEDEGLQFQYFGPKHPYNVQEQWTGWKYGFDEWQNQEAWVKIGLEEWGNEKVFFDYPVTTQAAFLRCR